MFNKDHVENSLAKIRLVFEKASEKIEAIPTGSRIPATKLADDLAKEIGMTGATLYPTLKFLLEGYPNRVIKRGAHGGIENPLPKKEVPESSGIKIVNMDTGEIITELK